MIVPDVNLLLYAYDTNAIRHRESAEWLADVFSDRLLVGLPWQVIHGFVRISTNPKICEDRFPMERAVSIVEQWIARDHVRLLSPGSNYWGILRHLLIDGQVRGSLTTDAQLAAVTIEYGGVLYTTDRDFARFPGLRRVNPLAES